ncbi:MAG: iron ABC transporter permease [Chloroflexi bacterium]|nr:iron ABC transporter permease [Chloroflexota bacterium]
MSERGRGSGVAGGIVVAGALLLLVVWPVAVLVGNALADGVGPVAALASERSLEAWRGSLIVATAVTALAVAGGLGAALLTERVSVRGRGALRVAMLLPLLVPDFVAALSWQQAYAPGGLVDDLTGIGAPWLFGPAGVILVLAAGAVPLAYVVIAAGLATRAEPELERAARASGAGRLDVWRSITIPLAAPSIGAATTLVMVTSMNAFAIPSVLGTPDGFATMTTRIYRDLAFAADSESFSRVLALSVLLAGSTLLVIGAADRFLPRGPIRSAATAGGPGSAGRPSWWAAVPLWGYLALTTVLPLIALLLTALTRGIGLPPVPANWTLDHFAEALGGRFLPAITNTFVLAVAAATGALVLGAVVIAASRRGGGRSLGSAVAATFAIPGTVLAVAVLLAYGGLLRDTLWLVLVAFLAKFWALAHRPLQGAVDLMAPDPVRAARASGAGSMTVLRTITMPILRPAIAAAWLLVFVFALHEVTMSILLYGPGSETMAVIILNLQQLGDPTVTAALAVILTLVTLVAATPLLLRAGALRRFGWE